MPPCHAGPPITTRETVTRSCRSSLSRCNPTPPFSVRIVRLSRRAAAKRELGDPERSADVVSAAWASSICATSNGFPESSFRGSEMISTKTLTCSWSRWDHQIIIGCRRHGAHVTCNASAPQTSNNTSCLKASITCARACVCARMCASAPVLGAAPKIDSDIDDSRWSLSRARHSRWGDKIDGLYGTQALLTLHMSSWATGVSSGASSALAAAQDACRTSCLPRRPPPFFLIHWMSAT